MNKCTRLALILPFLAFLLGITPSAPALYAASLDTAGSSAAVLTWPSILQPSLGGARPSSPARQLAAPTAGAVPESGRLALNNLLQFTSGGSVLGFQDDGVYVVSTQQALHIEFVNARDVQPQSSTPSSPEGKANPLDQVTWTNLWSGISLTYQATESGIAESVYTLAAGAAVDQIHLRYNALARIDPDGSLALDLGGVQMKESAPRAWQEIQGQRVPVQVEYRILGSSSVGQGRETELGFVLGPYDPAIPLTIDPTLTWYQFFGTGGTDWAQSIVLDSSGNAYVTGYSDGTWASPNRAYSDSDDAFVAKFSGTNGALVWNTFLGGPSSDRGLGIALYNNTYLYVVGYSDAPWPETPLNPFTTGTSAQDAFVAKLDLAGNLVWHTFIGGTAVDSATAVALDTGGNLYVAGISYASWGSPKRDFSGKYAAFVAKLQGSGTLVWNMFMGGTPVSGTYADGITVDSSGYSYVLGRTDSTWGSPKRDFSGAYDVFAAKVDPLGSLTWNTFLGSTNVDDTAGGIALDGAGNVYVAGYSAATWGAPQQDFHGTTADSFVAKLKPLDGGLIWNTFVGGTGYDNITDLIADWDGNTYVSGFSGSSWGSPTRPFTPAGAYLSLDGFAARLNSSGYVVWNTFLGGSDRDYAQTITLGATGVFVAGASGSSWGSPPHAYAGGADVMVTKVNIGDGGLQWNTFQGNAGSDGATAIALDANDNLYITGYTTGSSWGGNPPSPSLRRWSGGQDGFVVKMNSEGNRLWYTFLGGTGTDIGNAIVVDSTAHVYVAGNSNAPWGSLTARPYTAGYDGFLVRLDANTGVFQMNTFLGGSGTDYASGIALDPAGNAYVAGDSTAAWGSSGPFGTGAAAYVAKVSPSGALTWNSFLGGAGDDRATAITMNYPLLFVAGTSTAGWGASPKRDYTSGSDAFVAQVNVGTGDVLWNTFLGGTGSDVGVAITTDSAANVYVVGMSSANWGPTPKRPYSGGLDTFVSKLNALGDLQWNTFLGSSNTDEGTGIAVNNEGHIYVVGNSIENWGTPVMPINAGIDGYVAALNMDGSLWWNTFTGGGGTDYNRAIAVDGNEIYVAGSSNRYWEYIYTDMPFVGGFDVLVARMDGRGQLFLPAITR